jgi:hypothetical protein
MYVISQLATMHKSLRVPLFFYDIFMKGIFAPYRATNCSPSGFPKWTPEHWQLTSRNNMEIY